MTAIPVNSTRRETARDAARHSLKSCVRSVEVRNFWGERFIWLFFFVDMWWWDGRWTIVSDIDVPQTTCVINIAHSNRIYTDRRENAMLTWCCLTDCPISLKNVAGCDAASDAETLYQNTEWGWGLRNLWLRAENHFPSLFVALIAWDMLFLSRKNCA